MVAWLSLERVKPCPHCHRKRRLSQKSATVAEFGDCRRCLAVLGVSRRFLRQSPFSTTVALFCDSVDRALIRLTIHMRYVESSLRSDGDKMIYKELRGWACLVYRHCKYGTDSPIPSRNCPGPKTGNKWADFVGYSIDLWNTLERLLQTSRAYMRSIGSCNHVTLCWKSYKTTSASFCLVHSNLTCRWSLSIPPSRPLSRDSCCKEMDKLGR